MLTRIAPFCTSLIPCACVLCAADQHNDLNRPSWLPKSMEQSQRDIAQLLEDDDSFGGSHYSAALRSRLNSVVQHATLADGRQRARGSTVTRAAAAPPAPPAERARTASTVVA